MDVENKYGTLEIQKELLILVKEFDSFCVKNEIRYSLSSGSLLGAVRHKGFIPWDDDCDCIMNRENYNLFVQKINGNETLRLESVTESSLWTERVRFVKSDYTGPYSPTLDLFIIDNCPDNLLMAKIKLLTIKALQGMIKYHLSLGKGSWVIKFCSLVTFFFGRLFSHETKYRWYSKVAQWGNNTPSRFMKIYHDQYNALRFTYPVEIVQDVVRMPFEDTEIYGFSHYDDYLRIIYGENYMTPPTMENRIPIHI